MILPKRVYQLKLIEIQFAFMALLGLLALCTAIIKDLDTVLGLRNIIHMSILCVILTCFLYWSGFFDAHPLRIRRKHGHLFALLLTGLFIPPVLSLISYFFDWFFSLGILFLHSMLYIPLLLLSCFAFIKLYKRPGFRCRIVIVGAGWAGCTMASEFLADTEANIEIVGFIDDDRNRKRVEIEGNGRLNTFDVLGGNEQLLKLCSLHNIDIVVTCITHQRDDNLVESIYSLRKAGFIVEEMPSMYEKLFQKIPVYHMGHNFYSFEGEIQREEGAFLVRFYNILLSICLLGLYMIAAFPLVYLIVRTTIGKGVFFIQERIGLWDEPFFIYKVKTMKDKVKAPNKEGLPWAQKNDPRVPTACRIIRDLKLDEFPQLWNVIRGDMNLIGPRPQMRELLRKFEKAIPYYSRRHLVRPGITGWAQINHSALRSTEDAIEGLQYDLYYVKHRTFSFDMYILFRTVERVLKFDRI